MAYGFLDEAGDAGAGPRSSPALVVAVVVTGTPQVLRREVKKVRTRLGKKKLQIPEFKASQSAPEWNRKRLERLAKLNRTTGDSYTPEQTVLLLRPAIKSPGYRATPPEGG